MKKLLFLLTVIYNLSNIYANASSLSYKSIYQRESGRAAFSSRYPDTLAVNSKAPEFGLLDITGKRHSITGLKGKIIVLNFWFIACKPCINEMPTLNEIEKKYAHRNVVFLALALDKKDDIKLFLKNNKFNYIIIPNSKVVSEKYKINAYPASMVIDRKGIVRFIQIGGPNIGPNLTEAIARNIKENS